MFSVQDQISSAKQWTAHSRCEDSAWLWHIARTDTSQEGRECCINLKEDQPNAVAAMLYWLYHNEYSESGLRPPDWSRETFHTEVYVLADKYVLHGLRQEAKTKLEKVVENNWACSSFPDLVEDLYRDYADDNGHSDHELLRLVKAVAVRHAKELFAPGPKYAYFKEVSRRINGFATDVLAAHLVTGGSKSLPQSSAISMQPTVRYRCPGCHATFSQPAIDHLEFYTHLCMQMANAQRWRAPMSGASWQRHTVHSMEDSDDESL